MVHSYHTQIWHQNIHSRIYTWEGGWGDHPPRRAVALLTRLAVYQAGNEQTDDGAGMPLYTMFCSHHAAGETTIGETRDVQVKRVSQVGHVCDGVNWGKVDGRRYGYKSLFIRDSNGLY